MPSTIKQLLARYVRVRRTTEAICAPLEIDDHAVQPVDYVSPPKWHLGHTTWFFEAFILQPYLENYKPFNEKYQFVFNSCYESLGERVNRANRGGLSRPTVDEVHAYREHVDNLVPDAIFGVSEEQV